MDEKKRRTAATAFESYNIMVEETEGHLKQKSRIEKDTLLASLVGD